MESTHYLACDSSLCGLNFVGAVGDEGIARVREVRGVRIGFCTWTVFLYLFAVR